MTHEEYANELIEKFLKPIFVINGGNENNYRTAKEIAIIHCDLMIEELETLNEDLHEHTSWIATRINYYKQAKDFLK